MFRKLVRRCIITSTLPLIVIAALMIYISVQLSLLDEFRVYSINNIDKINALYEEGKENIHFILNEDLKYAGFDLTSDDKVIGKYYYRNNDNDIRIIVLSNETASRVASGETGMGINALLRKDSVTAGYMEGEFDKESGLGDGAFKGYVNQVFIDETLYPERRILLVKGLGRVGVLLLSILIVYMIISLCMPELALCYKRPDKKRSRRKLFDNLDCELTKRMQEKDGNVYITDNYIVTVYLSGLKIEKS